MIGQVEKKIKQNGPSGQKALKSEIKELRSVDETDGIKRVVKKKKSTMKKKKRVKRRTPKRSSIKKESLQEEPLFNTKGVSKFTRVSAQIFQKMVGKPTQRTT